MKKLFFCIGLLCVVSAVKAQDTVISGPPQVLTETTAQHTKEWDKYPSYPGGLEAFYKYLSKRLSRHLPKNGGRIFVEFTVNTDGSITDVVVKRGIDENFDKKVVKTLISSPKWEPGVLNGVVSKATYSLPLQFAAQ